MTAQQISEHLPEVAQATLYRHLNLLLKGDILYIAEERPVRGTVEKVYGLNQAAASLTPGDLAKASREDLMQYFTVFISTVLGDFARYLKKEHVDMMADGAGFVQVPLYLNDQELVELAQQQSAATLKLLSNGPGNGRKRRTFTSIVIPDFLPFTESTKNETNDEQ